jgi:predicted RND superfamily exporter protein
MAKLNFFIRRRWLTILLAIVFVGLCGSGLRFLKPTYDYRIYFADDDPEFRASEALQEAYTHSDNVLFVVAPKDGNVFSGQNLATVSELTASAWKIPYSRRVDSVTNFQYSRADGDSILVEDLVTHPTELSAEKLSELRTIAVNEPILRNRLISPSGHVTGVNATINLPGLNPDEETKQVVAYARGIIDEILRKHPDVDIYLTGIVMMNNAFPEASEKDTATLIPAMFGLVILGLWWMTRSGSATFSVVLTLLFTIISAMGLAGYAGIKLSPAASAAPLIILTVVIADCIHPLTTYLGLIRRKQASKKEAMAQAVAINGKPLLLTSATTATGFLTLNFADSPPFHDLGNITAAGVIIAALLSLTFMPAIMTLLPVSGSTRNEQNRSRAWLERFANFVVAYRNRLLWGSMVFSLALGSFVTKNELNDEFVKYFDPSIPVRQATEFATDNLTGVSIIEYSINAGENGGINNPEFLKNLDKFAAWYRLQPEVLHVNVITDTLKRLNRNMHGDDASWYRLPEDRALSAQYLLMYEMSLPFGLDLNNQVNINKSATRVTVTLKNLTNNDLLALELRAREWMGANWPAAMQAPGIGWSMMFGHIAERNINSMVYGIVLEMLGIALFLIVPLRSIKLGLFSLIPNVLPGLLAFGIWGLLVGRIGLAASIIVSITLGIIVDDTIHFTSKYLYARRSKGLSPEDAARYAIVEVGEASMIMSVVLMAGFGLLAFSTFQINSTMGLMSALTILIGLVMEGLMLPPLLMLIEGRDYKVANVNLVSETEKVKL